ncbi:MAG: hypothetical protein JNG84_04105, partial [Archangium sp.]|nr:hypothetical protein [Archangium sp.]
ALADASGLQAALASSLGDALSAPTLHGVTNVATGRRPSSDKVMYAGGSLGGVMGFCFSLQNDTISAAVLNVPGAGWTHFIDQADIWSTIDTFLRPSTPSSLDRALGLAMTQTNWDPVDGAAWSRAVDPSTKVFLEQMSVGDPVLPNIGSDLLAAATGARLLGAPLTPWAGLRADDPALGVTTMTHYRVPPTEVSPGAIHGFADRNSAAGLAARAQVLDFVTSVFAGTPRATLPATCTEGACDFAR